MSDLLKMAGVFLLAAHLLAMNVAAAGPLVCVWLHYRARGGDEVANSAGRRLARWSLWCLLAGSLVGVVQLAMLWAAEGTGYRQAVERFPMRTFGFAASELAFTAVCLVLYAGLWAQGRVRPWLHACLAVVGATNLLYHFPPLMVALGELAVEPEWVDESLITRPVFRGLMVRPELIAEVLHFTLASVAVGGVLLMSITRRQQQAEGVRGAEGQRRLIRAGGAIAIAATLPQAAVGTWLLVQLPYASRNALIGDDWLATGLFFSSIVATLGMCRALGGVALGEVSAESVRRSVMLTVVVIILMTGSLTRSRAIESLPRASAPRGRSSESPAGMMTHFR